VCVCVCVCVCERERERERALIHGIDNASAGPVSARRVRDRERDRERECGQNITR
jgi:hypothetical protein